MLKSSGVISVFVSLAMLMAASSFFGQKSDTPLSVDVASAATVTMVNTLCETDESPCLANINIDGKIIAMDVEDYIICVVAGEVSPDYSPEALKAQAVAARTYLYRKLDCGGCAHGGDICTSYAHCQAYKSREDMQKEWGSHYDEYYASIYEAVSSTKNLIITYNSKPISALYHSSSVGKTEDCASVFGDDLPYLVSVDTELNESDSDYSKTVVFGKNDFTEKLNSYFNCDIDDISFDIVEKTPSGRVAYVAVDGKSYAGTEIRAALGLRSTDFTYAVSNNSISITTYGYGHGVGMSQHGAQLMALEGCSFEEILLHYYPLTKIEARR